MKIGTKVDTKTISLNCKNLYKSMVFLLGRKMAEGIEVCCEYGVGKDCKKRAGYSDESSFSFRIFSSFP